jgi:hypothetical protein
MAKQAKKIVCRWNGGPVVEGVKHVWKYHSPTGFAWGYGGSGPADLALNILLMVTGNRDVAFRYHQDFKWEFIAPLPEEGGEINVEDVKEWLRKRGWNDRLS